MVFFFIRDWRFLCQCPVKGHSPHHDAEMLWGSSLCLLICQMEEERCLSCVAPEGRIGTKGQMWWGGWLDSPSRKGFGAVQPVANSLTRQWVVAFPWAHFNGGWRTTEQDAGERMHTGTEHGARRLAAPLHQHWNFLRLVYSNTLEPPMGLLHLAKYKSTCRKEMWT